MTEKEERTKGVETEAAVGQAVRRAPQDTDSNARFDGSPTDASEDEKAAIGQAQENRNPTYLPHLGSYLPYLPTDPRDDEKAAVRKEQENQNSTYLPHLGSYLSYLPADPQEDEKAAMRKEMENENSSYLPHLGSYLPYRPKDPKDAEKGDLQHDGDGNRLCSSLPSEARLGTEEAHLQGAAILNEELPAGNSHSMPEDEVGIPPPLPTTNLRRGRNVPHQSRAGAFLANGGGTDLVPAGTANDDLGRDLSMPSGSNHQRNSSIQVDESGLARARLVSDEEDQHRVIAMEHDAHAMAKKREQFLRKWALVFVVFLAVLVCGVAIPLLMLGKEERASKAIFDNQNKTNATKVPITLVVSGLPSYTIAALEDKDSPQSQAHEWLLNDPNLGTLSDARKLQRFALATLYFATGGGDKKWGLDFKWLEYDQHECDWFNTAKAPPLSMERCNTTVDEGGDPYIQAVALGFNGLVGAIPKQLAFLTGLRGLVLHGNKLTGTIPTEVIGLPKLEGLQVAENNFPETPIEFVFESAKETLWYLDLALNRFTGTIPTSIGRLTNLSVLDLYGIKASGFIPTELGFLSNLNYLDLRDNKEITGHIPTQLGGLTLLEHLSVGGNLEGTFPTQLGALTRLTKLYTGHHNYTGYMPSEVGRLSHLEKLEKCAKKLFNAADGRLPSYVWKLTRLRCLDLEDMALSGTIPLQLSNMTNLDERLDLSHNTFSGTVPMWLGQMTALTFLDLARNGLSGPIPTELGQMSVSSLLLGFNSLTGAIPSELESLAHLRLHGMISVGQVPTHLFSLTKLTLLDLSNSHLSGSVPIELAQLSGLRLLDISDNSFHGTLPKQIFFNWREMQFFKFRTNQLRGSLPTEMGMMTDSFWLLANDNQFTGKVPSEIGRWEKMDILDISNNDFSGSIPDDVWKLPKMVHVSMERNQLSGTLWQDIGFDWPGLRSLRLRSNRFQDRIPSSIGLLESLDRLDLQDNFLWGTVPAFLGSLDNLKFLDLDGNLLHGTVPSSLGMLTKLARLALGNQPLEGTLPSEVWMLPVLEQLSLINCNISGKIPSSGLSSELSQFWIQDSHLTGVLPNKVCSKEISFNCSDTLCGCTCPC